MNTIKMIFEYFFFLCEMKAFVYQTNQKRHTHKTDRPYIFKLKVKIDSKNSAHRVDAIDIDESA